MFSGFLTECAYCLCFQNTFVLFACIFHVLVNTFSCKYYDNLTYKVGFAVISVTVVRIECKLFEETTLYINGISLKKIVFSASNTFVYS